MATTDQLDGLNPLELAACLAIAGVAAIRQGQLTTRQENRIDRIVAKAKKRQATRT